MATWEELSRENLRAAKLLVGDGCLRSSVSRSYYAAYCAIAGAAARHGVSFPHGLKNPSHEQLPDLVRYNLALPREARRRVQRQIRILREARESADYRPGVSLSRTVAVDCLRLASWILQALEIDND